MNQRIYHGNIEPNDLANTLIGSFHRGSYAVRCVGSDDIVTVQIATLDRPQSGGRTSLTARIEKVEDGISVTLGQQEWVGLAASLGSTALSTLRNPFALLGRLDDLAQDIESLQLNDKVMKVIDSFARSRGLSMELSNRLRRIDCDFCSVANPVGQPSCIACGAPLGKAQPQTCLSCGFVIREDETYCANCGIKLS